MLMLLREDRLVSLGGKTTETMQSYSSPGADDPYFTDNFDSRFEPHSRIAELDEYMRKGPRIDFSVTLK
jgi:hypothetical protein